MEKVTAHLNLSIKMRYTSFTKNGRFLKTCTWFTFKLFIDFSSNLINLTLYLNYTVKRRHVNTFRSFSQSNSLIIILNKVTIESLQIRKG